ncbi:hypothetical protein [Glycomyces sp. NPDC047010]|uniref:hypothetical protein n=1 Tax=Glycomyces sp. NPDC047010 TaxID=3155023 RepID=UPI003402DDAF
MDRKHPPLPPELVAAVDQKIGDMLDGLAEMIAAIRADPAFDPDDPVANTVTARTLINGLKASGGETFADTLAATAFAVLAAADWQAPS